MRQSAIVIAAVIGVVVLTVAQESRPMSPRGTASAQVLGRWVKAQGKIFTLGQQAYEGGKWIDISYGRPLKRGRELFGAGPDYGKATLIGAPIWRAGADVSTRLKTEVPLVIDGKTVPAGEYSLFIDLKEKNWTFVVSSWAAQARYDPNDTSALWGAYNYTADKDVVRTRMKLETLAHSHEQLTWEFVDMTDTGGALAITWGTTFATVPFTLGR
jgi:DUF2911 family protein